MEFAGGSLCLDFTLTVITCIVYFHSHVSLFYVYIMLCSFQLKM